MLCPGKQRTEAQLSVTVLLEVAQPSGVIANGSLEGYDVKKKSQKNNKNLLFSSATSNSQGIQSLIRHNRSSGSYNLANKIQQSVMGLLEAE